MSDIDIGKAMYPLPRINGNPYTKAAEDLVIQSLQHDFLHALQQEIGAAFQRRRPGERLQIDMGRFKDLIAQAYYLGKDAK